MSLILDCHQSSFKVETFFDDKYELKVYNHDNGITVVALSRFLTSIHNESILPINMEFLLPINYTTIKVEAQTPICSVTLSNNDKIILKSAVTGHIIEFNQTVIEYPSNILKSNNCFLWILKR